MVRRPTSDDAASIARATSLSPAEDAEGTGAGGAAVAGGAEPGAGPALLSGAPTRLSRAGGGMT